MSRQKSHSLEERIKQRWLTNRNNAKIKKRTLVRDPETPGSQYSILIGTEFGDLNAHTVAAQIDRDWFQAHPNRSHRIRPIMAGEGPGVTGEMYAVVRQQQPGLRLRRFFKISKELPKEEAPEHVAHAIFDLLEKYHGRPVPSQEFFEKIWAYSASAKSDPSSVKPPRMH